MKGKPGKSKGAPDGTVPNVRVLKSAQCRSLSGRSTLTYEVGATPDGEVHLRVTSNSGSGCFGREWVPLRALQRELAKSAGPITSGSLQRAFAGKSQNTGGFVLAALSHEGLLKPLRDTRGYQPSDGVDFMREVRRLLEKGPSPTVASVVARKADAAVPPAKKAKAPSKAKAGRR